MANGEDERMASGRRVDETMVLSQPCVNGGQSSVGFRSQFLNIVSRLLQQNVGVCLSYRSFPECEPSWNFNFIFIIIIIINVFTTCVYVLVKNKLALFF